MNDCVRDALDDRRLELVAKCCYASTLLLSLFDYELGGAGKSDYARNVFCSRSASTILCPTVQQRLQRSASSNEQRADSLRSADLVTGNRKEIELLLACIDLDFSKSLHRVGVHQHPSHTRVLSESRHRLNRSDLIV